MDILKKYYLHFIVGFLGILMLGIYGLYAYEKFGQKEKTVNNAPVLAMASDEEQETEEQAEKTMHVEIKGQVVNPGVYAVTTNNIINDVIEMAGGLTENAYTRNINLSKRVSDEMVIIIYSSYEYSTLNKPDIVYVEKPCKCESVDITSCIDTGSSVIEEGPSSVVTNGNSSGNSSTNKEDISSSDTTSELININTASQSELEILSGIGEAKASAIIKYREENGNFKTIQDIVNVSGISQALFDKIKDYITV